MSIGIWQIAIVVILVVLLFGRGKISSLMGDVAKGIKSFKKGMASDVTDESEPKNISDDNQDSDNNVTDESEPKNISDDNQDSDNKS
jgi:sec-independent protein translocase protein TatA